VAVAVGSKKCLDFPGQLPSKLHWCSKCRRTDWPLTKKDPPDLFWAFGPDHAGNECNPGGSWQWQLEQPIAIGTEDFSKNKKDKQPPAWIGFS